jgi:hypothetical protein
MCLSRKVVAFLERSNERDFDGGRASYETYARFCDIVGRCRSCRLFDNGVYGDMYGECRLHVLRVFVSMKRDVAQLYLQRAEAAALAAAGRAAGAAGSPSPEEAG